MTYGESPYIFGLHELDDINNNPMVEKGKKGWIVFTEAIGRDRNDTSGKNFRPWADAGYGVIVRLNHGYGTNGTLPYQRYYEDFAQRAANYVNSSPGAHIWVIGNECNLAVEWPRYEGTEEPITAERYVDCFRRVRSKIKALPGHSGDQVVMQGVGPWNTQIGQGWIEYYVDILNRLGSGGVDGIALHTYTHNTDPALIFSEQKMDPPYNNRYYQFRTYKDFMNANPSWARSLPVYITETDQDVAWADTNSGWVKNAYTEINSWNQNPANQKIRALVLYRWPSADEKYHIQGRQGVINDFKDAMNNNYVWASSSSGKIALKAANGQYVVAEGGGGREVLANRNSVGAWETFELVQLGGNRVALKAANGQYVVAEGGGGREVLANRNSVGAWETFELVQLGGNRVVLKAANGQYVVAEGGGGREVLANRNAVGAWETFELISL
jgi:hypothetical protein